MRGWHDAIMSLDQEVLEHWMAGDQVPGVGFGLYEPVVITAGPLTGTLGAVVALVALTPGPVYTVEIGGGRGDVHVLEADLAEA
jgi:hypothetical protein